MVAIWVELLGIIALPIVVFTILGAPAATFLPGDVSATARIAVAPVLGLSIAICLLTNVNWLLPARTAVWVGLLPALVVAVVVGWRRRRRLVGDGRRPLVLPILVLVVAAGLSSPLAYQHAFGTGGYQVWDGPNYASLQTGLMYNAVHDRDWGPAWSVSVYNGEYYGPANPLHQQIGFDSVAATLDAAAHLRPVDTQVGFMIALVVIGALGALAAFLMLLPGRLWAALLAGCLYAGPVLFQLVLDGSEGALTGIAHLLPLLALGLLALRPGAGRAPAALLAVVGASCAAAYPVYFPIVVTVAGLIWLVVVVSRLRKPGRRVSWPEIVLPAVRNLALVGAGVAIAAPFAFHRSIGYWHLLIKGGGSVGGLPVFDIPLPTLPSYVLGTREFFYLPHLSDTNVTQWFLADVFPLAMIGLIVFTFVRLRLLWPVALLAVVLIVEAYAVSGSGGGCTYCLQRSLLPLGPVSAFVLAAGTAVLAASAVRPARLVAGAVGLAVLALSWHTDATLIRRGAVGAYFLPRSVASVLDDADKYPGPVFLEGFTGSFDAPGEFPTALLAADGGGFRPGGPRLSLIIETNDFAGLAYLGPPRPAGPEWRPGYRTVITRLGAVANDRRTVRRSGGAAVQLRTRPFDVALENGYLINRARRADHRVFVNAPMTFIVTGPPGREVALHVQIASLSRGQLGRLPRGSRVKTTAGGLSICLTLPGERARTRRTVLPVPPGLVALAPPGELANRPVAVSGPTLIAMHVVSGCSRFAG